MRNAASHETGRSSSRPDQYVAGVFPLDGVDGVQELAVFFDAWLL